MVAVSEELSVDAFRDVLQRIGSPVVSTADVSAVMDRNREDIATELDALAEAGLIGRRDVADREVWYPVEWEDRLSRERVLVFQDRRELVVDQPRQFTRAQLAQFAHLVASSGRGSYLYRIRPVDIWNAPYRDIEELERTIRDVIGDPPAGLMDWIDEQWRRSRQFRLETHSDGYTVLEAGTASLMSNVARQELDESHLRAEMSETESWVAEEKIAEIKRVLYEAGFPVQDNRELDSGDPLDVTLSVELREYQQDWIEEFLADGAGVLVGPPGSGKTVAGLGAMAEVSGETLILVPSRELAVQWRERILSDTDLAPAQVGEYHGGKKQLRPVTIATYHTAGMDRHRAIFDERRWGLITFDECLTGDTIVETPQGRRTFSELDMELDLNEGWNFDVDLQVRTYSPQDGEYHFNAIRGMYTSVAPVKKITTESGHVLRATPNHTHLVFDPHTLDLKEQQGVSEGDYLVQPLPSPCGSESSHASESQLTKAELTGWFIGDGHLNTWRKTKFSFGHHVEEQTTILRMLLDRLKLRYTEHTNSRGDHTLYVPHLADSLNWTGAGGKKANDVTVPMEAYTWSNDRVAALLRGLFDAEGNVTQSGRIEFNSTSRNLVSDVSILCQQLGLPTRRYAFARSSEASHTIYRLNIPSYFGMQFDSQIGFRLAHKSNRLIQGTTPAMGAPLVPILREIKSDLSLSERDLGSMIGVSRGTMHDILHRKHDMSQLHIPNLVKALSELSRHPLRDFDKLREESHVTYQDISDELDIALGTAHRRFKRREVDTTDVLLRKVCERQDKASIWGDKLRKLCNLRVVRVDSVDPDGTERVYDVETESHTYLANGFLTHNCQHIPSDVFRRTADLQGRYRLGLSASPVRGDEKEDEIFTLIGPPIGTDWAALLEAGFVIEPELEIRYLPWGSEDARAEYDASQGHERRQLAGSNPAKIDDVRRLRDRHTGEPMLIFVDWLDQGKALADALGAPFLSGETRHAERERYLADFRDGTIDTLVVSRVGDEGLDLPDASIGIIASGLGGSRRQGTQRVGRTMRPAGNAKVYLLATRNTREEDFALNQMRHLRTKGMSVTERTVELETGV